MPSVEDQLGHTATRFFQVEVVLAISPSHPRWTTVYHHCLFDRAGGKLLAKTHPELFSGVHGHEQRFDTPEPALALANYLNEHCGFAASDRLCGWADREDVDRGYPMKARVVMIQSAQTRTLITSQTRPVAT